MTSGTEVVCDTRTPTSLDIPVDKVSGGALLGEGPEHQDHQVSCVEYPPPTPSANVEQQSAVSSNVGSFISELLEGKATSEGYGH